MEKSSITSVPDLWAIQMVGNILFNFVALYQYFLFPFVS